MTPRQKELARHALGLDGRRQQSYRNRFFAGPGHDDYEDWVAMVLEGNARGRGPDPDHRPDHAFWLTRKGAMAALNEGVEAVRDALRAARDIVQMGPARSAYNSACDRLDVLASVLRETNR